MSLQSWLINTLLIAIHSQFCSQHIPSLGNLSIKHSAVVLLSLLLKLSHVHEPLLLSEGANVCLLKHNLLELVFRALQLLMVLYLPLKSSVLIPFGDGPLL